MTGGRARVGPYAEASPPPTLERWVERIWRYEARPGLYPPPHRVLPVASPSLAFSYRRGPDGRLEEVVLELVGPVHHPRSFRPGPGAVMEAVQVRPHWCRGILGVAGEEHVDRIRWGPDTGLPGAEALLVAGLQRLEAGGDALPVLLRWIEDRVAALRQDSAEWLAHEALARLGAPGGSRIRVRRVASSLGVSTRHLRRSVRSLTGASPKFLQRIARLNAVVAAADPVAAPPWSRLAMAHGYADQPHLIRDVVDLTGLTPAALHGERRGEHVRFLQSLADSSP